jgi:hypothetical protein
MELALFLEAATALTNEEAVDWRYLVLLKDFLSGASNELRLPVPLAERAAAYAYQGLSATGGAIKTVGGAGWKLLKAAGMRPE